MTKSASEWTYGVAACAIGIAVLQFYPVPKAAHAENPAIENSARQYAAADSVAEGQLEGHNAVADTSSSTGIDDALAADKPAKRRFDMSHVESVRMRVWGSSELNGEYSIEADSTISLPGIGRIEVGNLTPGELEKAISEKLSAFSRRDLTVSIEVSRYRSYYIVGQIANPGAIEWRPGLKVIQAISLAGGVTRPTGAVGDTVQRDQAQMQLKYSLAQLARLKAEKEGRATVDSSQEMASLMFGSPGQQQSASNFLAQQNAALDEQKAIMQTQLAGLERDKEGAQRELETAVAQEEAIGKQVEIAKSQLENVEALKDKNLISKPRLLAQRSDLISAQVRYAESRSIVERARGRIDTVSRQIISLQQTRRAALNDRIETLERDVAQLEASLGSNPRSPLNLRYHITREGKDEMSTVTAAVDTEVMPGDVVIISSGASELTTTSDARPVIERRVDTQEVLEASAALSSNRAATAGQLQGALRAMADRINR